MEGDSESRGEAATSEGRSKLWGAAAMVAVVLLVGAAVAAWQIRSIDIPILGSGGDGQAEAQGDAASEVDNDALRAKLQECVASYNRFPSVFPTEPEALVTLDVKGDCIVALDPFAGGSDGSVPIAHVERTPDYWQPYVTEGGDLDARIEVAEVWEQQRQQSPNAYLRPRPAGGPLLVFDEAAPLPSVSPSALSATEPTSTDSEPTTQIETVSEEAQEREPEPPTQIELSAERAECASPDETQIVDLSAAELTCEDAAEIATTFIAETDDIGTLDSAEVPSVLPDGTTCEDGPAGSGGTAPVACRGPDGGEVGFAVRIPPP